MRRRSLLVLALLLIVPLLSPSAAATEGRRGAPQRPGASASRPTADGLTRALRAGRIDRATYALERARALFDLAGVRARYGDVARPDGRKATMVLRDLLAVYDRLPYSERQAARSILARPTSNRDPDRYTTTEEPPYCATNSCIHYVATTEDAPPTDDLGGVVGVPDWVESVSAEFEGVWGQEIATFGFRAPKSDVTSKDNGGDAKFDIYLGQLGDDDLYGYCTTDDPNAFSRKYAFDDFSAYCVIDNDFAEFGALAGAPALRVTLAHEFFHAVQFAYDFFEDRWFMESSATWMEEQVFDAIDDNTQYLNAGALGKPWVPLDSNGTNFGVYGNWIFHQFISELLATGDVNDVTVMKGAWQRADASATGKDMYSIQAIGAALKAIHEVTFRQIFADFAMYNDDPSSFYEEAETESYPAPPVAATLKVTKRNGSAAASAQLDHLSNAYVLFVPGRGVTSTAKLRISLNLPANKTSPAASVVVVSRSGAVDHVSFPIDRAGDGVLRVAFGRGTIDSVDLVLTNASTRLDSPCWTDLPRWRYSCAANPKDDNLTYAFRATLLN